MSLLRPKGSLCRPKRSSDAERHHGVAQQRRTTEARLAFRSLAEGCRVFCAMRYCLDFGYAHSPNLTFEDVASGILVHMSRPTFTIQPISDEVLRVVARLFKLVRRELQPFRSPEENTDLEGVRVESSASLLAIRPLCLRDQLLSVSATMGRWTLSSFSTSSLSLPMHASPFHKVFRYCDSSEQALSLTTLSVSFG